LYNVKSNEMLTCHLFQWCGTPKSWLAWYTWKDMSVINPSENSSTISQLRRRKSTQRRAAKI